MTLILTTANVWAINQSSDYRLKNTTTLEALTDIAGAKQLSLNGKTFFAQIAFTGLARVGHLNTRNWIGAAIGAKDITQCSDPKTLADVIARASISFLKKIPASVPTNDRELTIVIGAAAPNSPPRLFVLSNFEDANGENTRKAENHLTVYEVNVNPPKSLVHGMRQSVSDSDRRYLKRLSESNLSSREMHDALSQINVRAAAQSNGWVSAQCMTSSLIADGTRSEVNHGTVPGSPDLLVDNRDILNLIRKRLKIPPGKQPVFVQSAGTIVTTKNVSFLPPPVGLPRILRFSSLSSYANILASDGKIIGGVTLQGLFGAVPVTKNQWSRTVELNKLVVELKSRPDAIHDHFFVEWSTISNIPIVSGAEPRTWDYNFSLANENGRLFFLMEQMSVALRSANTKIPLAILKEKEQLVMQANTAGLKLEFPQNELKIGALIPVQFLLQDFPEINRPLSNVEIRRLGAKKIGRNELCPCGSGKKYKKCHGKT